MIGRDATPAAGKAGSPALLAVGIVDRAIAYVAGTIAVLSTVIIFLSLMADVVVRYFSRSGLGWPGETPHILFPWLIMGGIVLAAHRGGHIAVPLVLDAMSKPMARLTLIVMQVTVFVVFSYLAWIAIDVVKITRNQLFPITRIPQLYSYSALVFGFGSIAVISIITLVRILHMDDTREVNADSEETAI